MCIRDRAKRCAKHSVSLIAIGNGAASRETDKLAADLIKLMAKQALALTDKAPPAIEKIVVSEAGASVYSASEFASQEMPDVDVSLRGAASIARRLQDPLAELVKIDPKSIGAVSYTHLDVYKRQGQGHLAGWVIATVKRQLRQGTARVADLAGKHHPLQPDTCLLYTSRCV